MTVVVTVLVLVALLASVAALLLPGVGRPGLVATVILTGVTAAVGLVAVLHGDVVTEPASTARWLLVLLAALAVLGGSPVTAAVLHLVDRDGPRTGGVEDAAEVLRGGAWIGSFERVGVFASLMAGWPEGIAVVLALKGLGRYSELRSDVPTATTAPRQGGVAERFIIGTFCSVLWAVGCAGLAAGLVSG